MHQDEADLIMKGIRAGAQMEVIAIEEVLAFRGDHQILVVIPMAEAEVKAVRAAMVEEAVHQEIRVADHLHIAQMAGVPMAEAALAVEKVHH
jgi:hypothetical protein